jgi:Transaldolase/Fructose-6-phosphate aldolase
MSYRTFCVRKVRGELYRALVIRVIFQASYSTSRAHLAKNYTVNVPSTWDLVKSCRLLSQLDCHVNVALCFSANQALLCCEGRCKLLLKNHRTC